MTTLSLEVYAIGDKLPELEQDVLVFEKAGDVAQVGARVLMDGGAVWVGAMGELLEDGAVIAWCELPALPVSPKLNPRAAWPFPEPRE